MCLYVPIEDCEFRDFWDIDWTEPGNKALRQGIIELQNAWFKGEIKNKEPHKRPKKPEWFLENILTSEGELEASYDQRA